MGINRVPTGIDGLDNLVDGGLPKESVTLISGGPGTGKTLFCSQFIHTGLENGEGAVFISLEQETDAILKDAKLLGFDFEEYLGDDLRMDYINPAQGVGFLQEVEYLIEEVDAERIAFDSTSVMGLYSDSKARIRERLYKIIKKMRGTGATTIMTAEIPDKRENAVSRFDVEEFVADGLILLYYTGMSEGAYRNIEVRKMRKTDHTPGTYPFEIEEGEGIVVKAESL